MAPSSEAALAVARAGEGEREGAVVGEGEGEEEVRKGAAEIYRGGLLVSCSVSGKTYTQQFSQIYFCRLKALYPALRAASHKKWSQEGGAGPVVAERILELLPGRESIVFGTIFANLSSKPNVLKDLENDLSLSAISVPEHYCGDSDQYCVEDESGRLELRFEGELAFDLITGVCVALRGLEGEDGRFLVRDACCAGIPPCPPRLLPTEPKFVVLVSGVEFGGGSQDGLALDLFFDFLMGNITVQKDAPVHASEISSVLFVGDTVCRPQRIDDLGKYGYEHAKYDMAPLRDLDDKLSMLVRSVPIALVPGPSDPSNCALPQNPIALGLLPQTAKLPAFQSFPNPASITVDGTDFIATAGQNIDDMARYVKHSSRVDLARQCLENRHLAPSAPDTLCMPAVLRAFHLLGCYPFFDQDPFVLEKSPHCYVIGGQPSFATSIVKTENGSQVRVILLPAFKSSKSAVLLDLRDLACRILEFA